jgi:hypothetical protein
MSSTTSNGAAKVVAELRAEYFAWGDLEQLTQLLKLETIWRVGAALAVLGSTVVLDPSLPPDELTRQHARACARYILCEGGICSEDELTAEIVRSVARPRVVGRELRTRRGSSLCAL